MPETSRNRASQKDLVGFVVGEVHYAVDIGRVQLIVSPTEITPLPHTPKDVAGVADHRGEVVPLIDLRVRFGLAPEASGRNTRWILLNTTTGRTVGLIVDAVTEVFGRGDGVRPTPDVGGNRDLRGITGVVNNGTRLTFVLDATRFFELADELASSGAF